MHTCLLLWFPLSIYVVLVDADTKECPINDPAVAKFREYVQIDTSRTENLYKAVEFWRVQAGNVGLEFNVHSPAGAPICVLTWRGANSSLPAIMLNSHMDVVPTAEAQWTYPPFSGHVNENCEMFGRGTQDTKDVAIQYLEAVRKLKEENATLQRTLHITLMPDEETGGFNGMRPFLRTKEFKDLNIGFALDEGLASSRNDLLYGTYQDRRAWSMNFTVQGAGGHGFVMPPNTALHKLQKLLNIMMEFRNPLEKAVQTKTPLEYGPYTSMNINMINGGMVPNVIPKTFNLVTDLRLAPTANSTEMLSVVDSWIAYAGNGTSVKYLRREMESKTTPIDGTNPFWSAMKEALNELGIELLPLVCPATSDMVHLRNVGIPAIGFAPKFSTVARLHAPDEYLNLHTFLRGIHVYVTVIKSIANC